MEHDPIRTGISIADAIMEDKAVIVFIASYNHKMLFLTMFGAIQKKLAASVTSQDAFFQQVSFVVELRPRLEYINLKASNIGPRDVLGRAERWGKVSRLYGPLHTRSNKSLGDYKPRSKARRRVLDLFLHACSSMLPANKF